MYWCFAKINGRSGEIYFDKNKNDRVKIIGHCYVKKEEFKTKGELRDFDQETKKFKIIYRNRKYKIIEN